MKRFNEGLFMRKRIYTATAVIIALACAFMSTVTVYAQSGKCWYVKRNGNARPGFPEDSEILKNYACYYIDDRFSDGSDKKVLYLTFDAGYDNGNVERILDALAAESVPAAFFVLDNIIMKNPGLIMRMNNEGHLVCNHTKRHKDLTRASYDDIRDDLGALENVYTDVTGLRLAPYFRFPEGKYSLEAIKSVYRLGYKTIFWSFAYADWNNEKQPDPARAISKILENTHNGAVMLFHPTSDTNAEIFPTLIREWKAQGYTFGTLDELTSQ